MPTGAVNWRSLVRQSPPNVAPSGPVACLVGAVMPPLVDERLHFRSRDPGRRGSLARRFLADDPAASDARHAF